jgi:hypothetical protein
MEQLWIPDALGRWLPQTLAAPQLCLLPAGECIAGELVPAGGPCAGKLLLAHTPGGAQWVLLAGPGSRVRVNGASISATGLYVLSDRDEIRLEHRLTLYFSTEALAEVVPFPGATCVLFCPRCKQPLEKDTPAMQCPGCDLWYHESEADGLPCWSYAERCAVCDQPTELGVGFRWSPEEL